MNIEKLKRRAEFTLETVYSAISSRRLFGVGVTYIHADFLKSTL
jgi:hypothetical protein